MTAVWHIYNRFVTLAGDALPLLGHHSLVKVGLLLGRRLPGGRPPAGHAEAAAGVAAVAHATSAEVGAHSQALHE